MNALQLAYIGDAVWTAVIRYQLVFRKLNVHHLHQQSVKSVNAGAQARMLSGITEFLTEREAEIVRRGRNAHPKHTIPKNQKAEDYAASTGFEALIGYLYMTGQDERMGSIIGKIKEQETEHG